MATATSTIAVTELFKSVKANSGLTAVTNSVFKYERPLNFDSACYVINALPLTYEQLQTGVLNLNFFAPNLINAAVNPVDKTQPDSAKLALAESAIIAAFEHKWNAGGFLFDLSQTTVFKNDPRNEWYVNARIKFYNINLKN